MSKGGGNQLIQALTGKQQTTSATTNAPSDSTAAATAGGAAATTGAGGKSSGFLSGLMDNPLFNAGAGIALLGAAATALRSSGKQLAVLARKQLTTSLEVTSKDPAYAWVLQWISSHAGKRSTHLGVETQFARHESGKIDTKFDFVPGPGRHWFWYGGRIVTVNRERDSSAIDFKSGTPWESVTLSTIGRSRDIFTRLLTEAKTQALQKEEGHTLIYTMGHAAATHEPKWEYVLVGSETAARPVGPDLTLCLSVCSVSAVLCECVARQFGRPRKRRPLDSVVLADGQKERIVADIREFTASQKWYIERGIPYRRGYLLYGPPGCGKTSFIGALAGELHYNICILNVNERGLTDDKLSLMLANAPPRSLILLEDVDAAFVKRDPRMAYNLSFSGLLNTLDGVTSSEERIIFMTTNHVERLDPALIRPGRVDVKEEITHADTRQIERMFLRFFPEKTELAKQFAAAVSVSKGTATGTGSTASTAAEPPRISMAQLQGYFLHFKTSPDAALADVQRMSARAADQSAASSLHQTLHEQEIARQIANSERILSGAKLSAPTTAAVSTASTTGSNMTASATAQK